MSLDKEVASLTNAMNKLCVCFWDYAALTGSTITSTDTNGTIATRKIDLFSRISISAFPPAILDIRWWFLSHLPWMNAFSWLHYVIGMQNKDCFLFCCSKSIKSSNKEWYTALKGGVQALMCVLDSYRCPYLPQHFRLVVHAYRSYSKSVSRYSQLVD